METSEFDKDKLLNKLKELSEEAPKEEAYKVWIDEINMLDSSNMDLVKL